VRTLEVEVGGSTRSIALKELADGRFEVRVDGGEPRIVAAHRSGGTLRVDLGGRQIAVGARVRNDRVFLQHHGESWTATAMDPRRAALKLAEGGSAGDLVTEMPGAVVRVPVAVGDAVRAGQVVVVVEAMKMQNEFKAPYDGVVERIAVEPGQTVEAGTLLAHVAEVEAT
jgi:acetyl-CoA/propionyl-CoA carboxylase biotin carboxyl carrier protein